MESKFTLKTIFTVVIAALLILGFIFLGYMRFSVAGMQDRANKLMAAGRYKEAYNLYEKIALKTDDKDVKEAIEKAQNLMLSEEAFKEGKEKLADGDYMAAIKAFSQVNEKDLKNYKVAQNLLTDASEKIFDDARKEAEKSNFKEALALLKKYINIVDDSSEAVSVYDEILLAEEEYDKNSKREKEELAKLQGEKAKELEKPSKDEEKEELKEKEINVKADDKKEKADPIMTELANSLKNKTHTIQSAGANVRSGPSIKSSSIRTIKRGDTIKVYDTVIDGTDRVWCLGTITSSDGEKFEGWVSSRNLDGTL